MNNEALQSEISNAWRQAGEELGIRVEVPFVLRQKDGREITFDAHILDFGSSRGTVVAELQRAGALEQARLEGFFCSALDPRSYRTFEPGLFCETLDDWGWFGEEGEQPDWYTGQPWG